MKPIHIISVQGSQLLPTLGGLQQIVNQVFAERNFRFCQLSVAQERAAPSIASLNGSTLFNCWAVLEADTMDDYNELMKTYNPAQGEVGGGLNIVK